MSVMPPRTLAVIFFLASLLVTKLVSLWVYGPVFLPDGTVYSRIADYMLSSPDWLYQGDFSGYHQPLTFYRVIGYPAFIAAMKSLSPDGWVWLVIGVQYLLSLTATLYVLRLAAILSGRLAIGIIAALAHGLGLALVLDQCILTDSLNASLLLILLCHTGIAILEKRRPTLLEIALLGSLVLLAFLFREAGSFLQILYWPLILYWGFLSHPGKLRPVLMLAVFALPMVLGAEAYKSWNEFRTGKRFITTGGQTAMFHPALGLEKIGVPVIAQDELLHDMEPLLPVASTAPAYNLARINRHLGEVHGFDAEEIARYGMSSFRRYWLERPLDMIRMTLSQLREKQAFIAFMPVESFTRLEFLTAGEQPWPPKGTLWTKVMDEGRIDLMALVAARDLSRLLSLALSVFFLLGPPLVFLRAFARNKLKFRDYHPAALLIFLYWLVYLGYTFAYAMVHLELRYLLPVEPLVVVTGLVLVASSWQWLKKGGRPWVRR